MWGNRGVACREDAIKMGRIDAGTCRQVVSGARTASTDTLPHGQQRMPLTSTGPGAAHIAVSAALLCDGCNDQRLEGDTEPGCLRVMMDTPSGWCKSSILLALQAAGRIEGRLVRHFVVDAMGQKRELPVDKAAWECSIDDLRFPLRLMVVLLPMNGRPVEPRLNVADEQTPSSAGRRVSPAPCGIASPKTPSKVRQREADEETPQKSRRLVASHWHLPNNWE